MAVDYTKKSKILKTDLCKRINFIDKYTYLNNEQGVVFDKALEDKYFELVNTYSYDDIKEARKINKASYQRIKRLRERISSYLIDKPCVWCTLTFRTSVLEGTSEYTRRQYVRRFLKSLSSCYIANIDYGDEHEREHYHALVSIDSIKRGSWPFGFDKYKKVRVQQKTSPVRLAKYISKLTNHAIKESTKRCYIIYSR